LIEKMPATFSDQQLQAYLDEALSSSLMAEIEKSLRADELLRNRLVAIAETREAGVHGLGEIWRRHRASCPTREQLGSYLLGAMDGAHIDYIRFHLEIVQCRICAANLEDLQRQNRENQSVAQSRRRKYFQTSAGYLSKRQDKQ
jgi:hypothetical protein